LAILLDPDLKQEVARLIGASNSDYTNIDLTGSRRPNNNNNTATHLIPLSVTVTTTVTKSDTKTEENVDKKETEESAESLLQISEETDIC
jgi:hypothetical protein